MKVVVGQQQEHVTHIANAGDRNGTTNKIKVGDRRLLNGYASFCGACESGSEGSRPRMQWCEQGWEEEVLHCMRPTSPMRKTHVALHSSPGFAWVELGGKIAHGGHCGKHLWRTCIVVRWCETETSESERAFFHACDGCGTGVPSHCVWEAGGTR